MAKPDKKQEVETVEVDQAQESTQEQPELTEAQLKHQKRQEKLQQKKQAKAKENKKDNKNKGGEQKPKTNKGKEIVGELKKVTWPTFGQVVKNTALVLGIVLLCTAALFVVDRLFSWIYQLLVSGAVTNWWF